MVTSPAPTISSHQRSGFPVVSELLTDGVGSFGPVVASSGLVVFNPGAAKGIAGLVAAETLIELVRDEEFSVQEDLDISPPPPPPLDSSSAPLPCSWRRSLMLPRRGVRFIYERKNRS